jgi:hypothetical protein
MGGWSGFTGVSRFFSLSSSDSQTVRRTSGSAPQVWANFRVSAQVGTRSPEMLRDR